MNTISPFSWLSDFARDCAYVTISPALDNSAKKLPNTYPSTFGAFLRAYQSVDLDGLRILSADDLLALPEKDAYASEISPDLMPFARDSNTADFFCFTPAGQVVRWSHDGGPGKVKYPDFAAFLLTSAMNITGILGAFQQPGDSDDAAAEKATRWETTLRQKLAEAGANLADPWWPTWENWHGI